MTDPTPGVYEKAIGAFNERDLRLEPVVQWTTGYAVMRAYGPAEWWLRLGKRQRLLLAIRNHRRFRPLFSERYRRHPHAWYLHIGPYCLHAKWDELLPGGPVGRLQSVTLQAGERVDPCLWLRPDPNPFPRFRLCWPFRLRRGGRQ